MKYYHANVKDYGAKGNGSADDTNAIRHALQDGPGLVYFPPGVYKVSCQLTVPRDVHVVGDGVEATVVTAKAADPKKFPDNAVFYFSGDGFSPLPGLGKGVDRFDTKVLLQSTTGLQPDDVLVIINPTPGSYSTHRPAYNAGEYVQVNEINGKEVRVVGGLQASYREGEVRVVRLRNPTRSSIRGMTVIGTERPDDDIAYCLRFRCGRGVCVRDVRLAGAHYALCEFWQCFGAQAENVEADQIFPSASKSGGNYGITISNCQDVRIVNCRITAMRHAVAIGGFSYTAENPNPVNRQISVSNCDLKATCDVQALDAHGNTESYTFENNRIHGGIDFGGMLGRIIGNDIYGRNELQPSSGLYATEWKGTEFEIRNNRIHTRAVDGPAEGAAIYLYLLKPKDGDIQMVGGPTIVSDNRVFVAGNAGNCRGLRAANYDVGLEWLLIVDGNDFYADAAGPLFVIERRAAAALFHAVVVRNNTFRNGEKVVKKGDVRQFVFRDNWPLPNESW